MSWDWYSASIASGKIKSVWLIIFGVITFAIGMVLFI